MWGASGRREVGNRERAGKNERASRKRSSVRRLQEHPRKIEKKVDEVELVKQRKVVQAMPEGCGGSNPTDAIDGNSDRRN